MGNGDGKGRGEGGLTWRSRERQVPINRTEYSVRERARVGGREFGRAIGSTQRDNWSAGAPRALSALLIINFCQHIDAIYNLLQMVVWSNLPLVAIYVCNTLLCIWWRKMWCKKIDVIVKDMRRLSHTIGYHLNLTLSLPRVINFKFLLQPHQKHYWLFIAYSDERWLY